MRFVLKLLKFQLDYFEDVDKMSITLGRRIRRVGLNGRHASYFTPGEVFRGKVPPPGISKSVGRSA